MANKPLKASLVIAVVLIIGLLLLYKHDQSKADSAGVSKSFDKRSTTMGNKIIKSNQDWHKIRTFEQYRITRKKGTEPPFSGSYYDFKEEGIYLCVCCDNELFSSETKFESGTGWPSFYEPISKENVEEREDRSLFMARTEVVCSRCDGHLGHVFADGPKPTGLRYCINSATLKFVAKDER